MERAKKIADFLNEQAVVKNSVLSDIKSTAEKNKKSETLLYIRAMIKEESAGPKNFVNRAIYYAFNPQGECVGLVDVTVINKNPPNQVEMEYKASDGFANQGNITILAKEAIKDIFDDGLFDELRVKDVFPKSNISLITVSIEENNLPSLAVARKLGFKNGKRLTKNDYLSSKENSITQPSRKK